ncbi:MAG: hypothetical protein ACOVNU_09940 [Candidatus Kapaibacteriota bacterium]
MAEQSSVRYLACKLFGADWDDLILSFSDEQLNIMQKADEMHEAEMHKCASLFLGREIDKSTFNKWYNKTFKTQ